MNFPSSSLHHLLLFSKLVFPIPSLSSCLSRTSWYTMFLVSISFFRKRKKSKIKGDPSNNVSQQLTSKPLACKEKCLNKNCNFQRGLLYFCPYFCLIVILGVNSTQKYSLKLAIILKWNEIERQTYRKTEIFGKLRNQDSKAVPDSTGRGTTESTNLNWHIQQNATVHEKSSSL